MSKLQGLWKNGKFTFTVDGTYYPDQCPKVRVTDYIYHPNIDFYEDYDEESNVCVTLLDEWDGSTHTFEDIVMAVLFLFYNPAFDDPLSSWSFDSDDEDTFRLALMGDQSLFPEAKYNMHDPATFEPLKPTDLPAGDLRLLAANRNNSDFNLGPHSWDDVPEAAGEEEGAAEAGAVAVVAQAGVTEAASNTTPKTLPKTTTPQELAYALWEAAGRPEGRDLEFWLAAETELAAAAAQAAAQVAGDARLAAEWAHEEAAEEAKQASALELERLDAIEREAEAKEAAAAAELEERQKAAAAAAAARAAAAAAAAEQQAAAAAAAVAVVPAPALPVFQPVVRSKSVEARGPVEGELARGQPENAAPSRTASTDAAPEDSTSLVGRFWGGLMRALSSH